MANIILPAVPVLDEIDQHTKLLIEQAGEINRYPISDLDIGSGDVTIDLSSADSIADSGNFINADTLGGRPANHYLLKNELILDDDTIVINKADIIESASGEVISINDSASVPIQGLKLFGKTTQNGTPTPEAPVQLVSAGDGGSVGVSVYGKNLFLHDAKGDYELNVTRYSVANGTLIEILDNGGVIVQGNNAENNGNGSYANGWYRPSNTGGEGILNASQAVLLNEGDTVTVSADYTIIEYGYGDKANIGVYLYDYEGYNNHLDIIYVPVGIKTKLQKTYTISQTAHYFPVFTLNSAKVQIENIQIELGNTVTEYEPYKAPQTVTISTPNDLPGIPVSSGGNYTDESGQQWICDEVDFSRGMYVQRIYECDLADCPFEGIGDTEVAFAPPLNMPTDANTVWVMCNYYESYSREGLWGNRNVEGFRGCCGTKNNIRIVDNVLFGTDSTAMRNYIKNQSDAGNPILIKFALATPIETPLSAEELAAYAALYTNYPNTTILNDSGAGMEVKYGADTKLYIDKLVKSILPIYVPQELTEEQKTQARVNIGAATVNDVLAALPTWTGGTY